MQRTKKQITNLRKNRKLLVVFAVTACALLGVTAVLLRPTAQAQSTDTSPVSKVSGANTEAPKNAKKPAVSAPAATAPTASPVPTDGGTTGTDTPTELTAAATCPVNTAAPAGLWVWQPSVATNTTERAAFFAFAKSKQIRTVYIESEKLINTDQAALATFIREAKQRCIDVELLFGAPEWAFTRNHAYPVSLAQKAVAFAKQAAVPPVGIQFDVEPYNLAEYKADVNAGANQYLDMLEKIATVTKPSNLYFAKAMPLGFEFRTVTRDGISMTMSHAVIDRVDRVVLMDYRDTAARIIPDASDEMRHAAAAGKKIIIGTETSCETGEVETITFCEEGAAYMAAELAKVHSHYKTHAAYGGLAIHDYSSYRLVR